MPKAPTPPGHTAAAPRRGRGFRQAGGLVANRIRSASESRGFVETRLLTHWDEIVGPEIATIARPVKVGYGRKSFGATLTLLVRGAHAPLVDAQSARIRERVNACYGYEAISRVRVTQTSPTGFAEAQAAYDAAPAAPAPVDAERVARTAAGARDVSDPGLRNALEALASNVVRRHMADKV